MHGEKEIVWEKRVIFTVEEKGRKMCVECWEIASNHSGFCGQLLELVIA
jgi:hypothetical protein